MRGPEDKTRLSYWFPFIEAAGLPVPRTEIVRLGQDEVGEIVQWLCDTNATPQPESFAELQSKISAAAMNVGIPFFLRTDFTSAKHDWINSCFVTDVDLLPHHIRAIWEYGECADMLGLPIDVWVVRELLKTAPLFRAFNEMPITREFRFFVRDGAIEGWQPYWPPSSIISPGEVNWRELLAEASVLQDPELSAMEALTRRASAAVPGYWSVDWLWTTDRGWVLTDMAEGEKSFKWNPTNLTQ